MLAIAAIAAIAVVACGIAGWTAWTAAKARSEIDAVPRWFKCNGVDVPFEIVNGDEEDGEFAGDPPIPAFVLSAKALDQPDTICQLTLTIVNRGSRKVDIKSVAFPMLGVGAGSGFPLELAENGANFPSASPNDPLSRAIVDWDEPLEGGDSMDLLFDLRARADMAPHAAGGTTTMTELPTIKVGYRGFNGTVDGSVALMVTFP